MSQAMLGQLRKELAPFLTRWSALEWEKFHRRKLHARFRRQLQKETMAGLDSIRRIEVLRKGGKPVAVFLFWNRGFVFQYAPGHRRSALPWARALILRHGRLASRHSRFACSERDDAYLKHALRRVGFKTRHVRLHGETGPALRRLVRAKNPPRTLEHLGLELRPLKAGREIDQVIALQKSVFSLAPRHGNLSHTPTQLRKDRKEYNDTIRTKKGVILGVLKKGRILGFMAGVIHPPYLGQARGGLTLCLHPSVQGRGITKTGYRLFLELLQKKGIRSFSGGTSQPAVEALGKIMGRRVQKVMYLKASWKR